jgi:hypothetical protein
VSFLAAFPLAPSLEPTHATTELNHGHANETCHYLITSGQCGAPERCERASRQGHPAVPHTSLLTTG